MSKAIILTVAIISMLFAMYIKADMDICFQQVHGQHVRYHWLKGCQIAWGDEWRNLDILGGGNQ